MRFAVIPVPKNTKVEVSREQGSVLRLQLGRRDEKVEAIFSAKNPASYRGGTVVCEVVPDVIRMGDTTTPGVRLRPTKRKVATCGMPFLNGQGQVEIPVLR